MAELPIRVATNDDWSTVRQLLQTVFHDDSWDETTSNVARGVFEPDRSLVVVDDDAVVGHASVYSRELAVPGAVLPAAHVTLVGVLPTHRRRGLLTRLMRRQLAEVPESIAVLWASEGRIYPRFGYGLASYRVNFSAEVREILLPAWSQSGQLRVADPTAVSAELAQVYQAVQPARPGWSSRDDKWWSYLLSDLPARRRGSTGLRAVLREGPDGLDGYALWRVDPRWDSNGPAGAVLVQELVAATPEAHLELWRFLFSIDLTRSVKMRLGSPDEPLLHLVDEPRRLNSTVGDGLYLRVVDLPSALSARRYAIPVDVVLEVTDSLLPGNAGRWRLIGDVERAACIRTDSPADLELDIADLGAAYLGGGSLGALAGAGRVRELRPGSLLAASAAFGWLRAPAALEIF